MAIPKVGVMGASANDGLTGLDAQRAGELAASLGRAIAAAGCFLITGATTGLPALVAKSFREQGGLAVGISPAENHAEHLGRYGLPDDGADVMIYTGFGYKGRNVINIHSSDIVIILGGATGTLNEFTIAYDEGKVIGVLAGSGGVADHIEKIVEVCRKPTLGQLFFDPDPGSLLQTCVNALAEPHQLRDRGVK